METFTFILGFLLGIFSLSMKRGILIIKLILSSGMGFVIMRLFNHTLYLLSPKEWYPEYFISANFFYGVLCTTISFFIIHYLTHLFLKKKLDKKYDEIFSIIEKETEPMTLKRDLVKLRNIAYKGISIANNTSIEIYEEKERTTEQEYEVVRHSLLSFFTIALNALLCSIFMPQISNWWSISITAFLFIISFILMITTPISKIILSIVK